MVGWDLSPFEEQNVLFEIQEFNSTNLPQWIISDFNIPQQYEESKLYRSKYIFEYFEFFQKNMRLTFSLYLNLIFLIK